MTSLFKKTLLTVSLACAALSAPASPVTWNLADVALTDGGSASGWFVWDAASREYGDYDILTSAANGLGWRYTSSDGNNIAYFQDLFDTPSLAWAGYGWGTPWISIVFSSALTDAGGTVALRDGYECSDITSTHCRWVTAGSVTALADSVPEPTSLALVGAALLGMTAALRRKRRAPDSPRLSVGLATHRVALGCAA